MSPAEQLAGITLDNGWTITKPVGRKPNSTGGHFSKGYIATHEDGRKGFLKALDYTAALSSPDPASVLQAVTTAYNFERTLCEKCGRLNRIVRAMESGTVDVNSTDPYSKVQYLIFELADGDVRSHLDTMVGLDTVFLMKTLHGVATGLAQLHSAEIAHQDLKPSNVLVYSGIDTSKICDLGRAWDKNEIGPYDSLKVAGDRTYAPPELLYQAIPSNYKARRFGCDLYHFGSLIVFLFTRTYTNALLFDALAPNQRPAFWKGTYSDLLPSLQAAFAIVLSKFSTYVPDFIREEITTFVADLCNPDPSKRGHKKNRGLNLYGLERYISRFDYLAHKAKLNLIKGQ